MKENELHFMQLQKRNVHFHRRTLKDILGFWFRLFLASSHWNGADSGELILPASGLFGSNLICSKCIIIYWRLRLNQVAKGFSDEYDVFDFIMRSGLGEAALYIPHFDLLPCQIMDIISDANARMIWMNMQHFVLKTVDLSWHQCV